MLTFVWNIDFTLRPGVGGTENFVLGHVRELLRRGIAAEIVTIWQGKHDGREHFPGIPFRALSPNDISAIDNPVVFASIPAPMPTKYPSYVNIPYPCPQTPEAQSVCRDGLQGKTLIVPSKAAIRDWSHFLGRPASDFKVIYPFAAPDFAAVPVPPHQKNGITRVLFASRLVPEKGIYTLMHAMHLLTRTSAAFSYTATSAGADKPDGTLIHTLLTAHPAFTIAPPCPTPAAMAALMAGHDIVVVPSSRSWREPFGMVSVEGQHAGCCVVAANDAGLPETDCGGLILVKPDDPVALAQGLRRAAHRGRLTPAQRAKATTKFTVQDSVDSLLRLMGLAG
jgi:D-inositol-3-phosphate glycosyltransferase